MNEKIIGEWVGERATGYTATCRRTASGQWLIGTVYASGNWAGGGNDLQPATDQEAMEWFERYWGEWMLPPGAREHFPSEMVD